jgi:glutamyl-tRNA synthetase
MNIEDPMKNSESETTREKIINKLFLESLPNPEEIEERYPNRELPKDAMVTRIAPSPTGFMHIGGVYAAMISERLAHQTNGVFYLRIEDTDKKREVEGATELITHALQDYEIEVDEGIDENQREFGKYGPYKQSERADIYMAFVKSLVKEGRAYPCFSSSEELEEMRRQQEAQGIRPGYYKQWAKWRNKSEEEVLEALEKGLPYVIRFRSDGNFDRKIVVRDVLLGGRELSENDQDIVIMKSDGLPTYHMAHVIDDHLMGTTHVIRGNEWLSSTPLHLQLFRAMNWEPPKYGHIFPIQKMDGTSKRKLSKRSDPEASVEFYNQAGYPKQAVEEYLLNLANSEFENWRKQNPVKSNREFRLTLEKLSSSSGPLFDFDKLNSISKEIVGKMTADEVYSNTYSWAQKYDPEVAELMAQDDTYTKQILNIERGVPGKARKDISKWSDVKREIEYFFDSRFSLTKEAALELLSDISEEDIQGIVADFQETYDSNDDKDTWFDKIKAIARKRGFAESAKEYKKEPTKYKGHVAQVAKVFRVLLAGRTETPDLYSIMQILGNQRISKRLSVLSAK